MRIVYLRDVDASNTTTNRTVEVWDPGWQSVDMRATVQTTKR
jgi:hypothetical protein